jgi:heme/copper-type cytochrome/quinol oxidase subunit 1
MPLPTDILSRLNLSLLLLVISLILIAIAFGLNEFSQTGWLVYSCYGLGMLLAAFAVYISVALLIS